MLQTRYFFMDEFSPFIKQMQKYANQTVTFSKGEYLKKANESFRCNYLILDGLCRLSVLHDSGSERIVGYWGNGSMYPIITKEQKFTLEYSIMVKAVTKTTALRFDVEATKAVMKDHPEVSWEMIDHYCKFCNLFLYNVTTEAYEPLKTRVCSMILIYYLNFKQPILPVSQNELSSLVGAKRTSVVKILRELKEQNFIDMVDGHINIISPSGLLSCASSFLELPAKTAF